MSLTAQQQLTGAQFSTYRVGGPLDEAYQPETRDEAVAVLTNIREDVLTGKKPLTILGWGSNTIIASRGIRGITLITKKMTWVNIKNPDASAKQPTRIEFGAGVHLAKAAKVAEEHALTGGEYMVGIPGTIGGAVRMNAGALGQETCEVTESATVFNLETGEVETWDHEKLAFRYRKSAIDPKKHIVLAATCAFKPGVQTEISRVMKESIDFRKAHHPIEPNGGSVFKNPFLPGEGKTSGRMLDELGAKNWTEGGVRISPMHANFIINLGHGTSTDILKLMRRMQTEVKKAYGVDLTPENLFIGDATDEEKQLWQELTGKAYA